MLGNCFYINETTTVAVKRLATEEEKQKLYDAIKANGYKWNAGTKTLEKLVEPKFKVGDVIQDIDTYKVMEDFVTYELAVKLKDKGFPQVKKGTLAMYDERGFWYSLAPTIDVEYSFESFDDYDCVCPTISQVLKWLREEKKLHLELWTVGKKPIKWCHTITTLNHVGEKQGWSSGTREDSYEAAAIAGIEYVIDNLI